MKPNNNGGLRRLPCVTRDALVTAVLALTLLLTACGTSEEGEGLRVVSLSPTATEMLFAIGAGDLVVAADEFSNYPPDAPAVDGLSGWTPNVETIASLNPTLVVSESPIEGLDALDIESLVLPAADSFSQVWEQMVVLGSATGKVEQADEAVVEARDRLDAAVALVGDSARGRKYYHELGPELYSVTSQTFIGAVYEEFGLINIADAHDPDGFRYPQLSEEIILAEDPDLIFLADTKCCAQTAQQIIDRPGWLDISAVQNGDIIELDDDIASRWGPRVADFVEAVAAGIEASG